MPAAQQSLAQHVGSRGQAALLGPVVLVSGAADAETVLQRGPPQNKPGSVRAPAIVTEFLSQGSLRGVLARKSDVIQGPLVRVLIAMDAAKVPPFVMGSHVSRGMAGLGSHPA